MLGKEKGNATLGLSCFSAIHNHLAQGSYRGRNPCFSDFTYIFQEPSWRMQLPGVSDAAGEFSFHSRNAQRVSIFPRDLHGWVLFFAPLIPCPYRPRLAAVQPNPQMWPNKLFSSYKLSTLYQARVEKIFFVCALIWLLKSSLMQ